MKRPTISGQRARSHEQRAPIRSRLCAAAEELFVEEGEAALSLRRLTAKVGCSPVAPYRSFSDKDAPITLLRAPAFLLLADTLHQLPRPVHHATFPLPEAYSL